MPTEQRVDDYIAVRRLLAAVMRTISLVLGLDCFKRVQFTQVVNRIAICKHSVIIVISDADWSMMFLEVSTFEAKYQVFIYRLLDQSL